MYRIVYFSPCLAYPDKGSQIRKDTAGVAITFEKYDLVICDEFGYVSCDKEGENCF
ncbi:hypothetical protein [Parabacteroides distasonis]|uniref:hypothetical protein n=1 Tax=Parabacteroides distasonis TaxID=823 RepID=UPI00351B7FE8